MIHEQNIFFKYQIYAIKICFQQFIYLSIHEGGTFDYFAAWPSLGFSDFKGKHEGSSLYGFFYEIVSLSLL